MNIKNICAVGLLSFAVITGTVATSTPVQATHKIGHAILGGIIGGIIGGAIINNNRNQNYYNGRNPNNYGVQVYQQPVRRRPVYAAPPRQRCWWQNDVYVDNYGRRRTNRVQVCS